MLLPSRAVGHTRAASAPALDAFCASAAVFVQKDAQSRMRSLRSQGNQFGGRRLRPCWTPCAPALPRRFLRNNRSVRQPSRETQSETREPSPQTHVAQDLQQRHVRQGCFPPYSRKFLARKNAPTAAFDKGTICIRPIFMRSAGTTQSSFQIQFRPTGATNFADRQVVRISTSSADRAALRVGIIDSGALDGQPLRFVEGRLVIGCVGTGALH